MDRRECLSVLGGAAVAAVGAVRLAAQGGNRRLLYVAEPGIRNYLNYGGIGIVVFDIDAGYRFVKRIPTWALPAAGQDAENVKGVAASAATGRIYVSTIKRVGCVDLRTEKMIWDKAFDGGCDRLAIAPDGATLYVPSLEGPHWNVVDAVTGAAIAKIVTNSGAHNTIYGPGGRWAYLAGLHSPELAIADTRTHAVVRKVGPFSNVIRPFTINGAETLVYVNVNDLLGFEVGDLRTGKALHSVAVKGYEKGPVDRHGCPSHGVALTPDERELWLADGHNKAIHVFDNTVMPPKQLQSIVVRDQPGWLSFSLDGRHAYSSTGEVFDARTKQRVAAMTDETGRAIGSEKQLEIDFAGASPSRAADQFGVGQRR